MSIKVVKKVEKRVDKNEWLNQLLLKVEEGKVRLGKYGIRLVTSLDDIRITESYISVTYPTLYIRVDIRNNELGLTDLVNNEIYVWSFQSGEVKVRFTKDFFYLNMEIPEITPLTQAVLTKVLGALDIPFSTLYTSRIDIEISKYTSVEYDSDNGLELRYGVDRIQITKDKLIVNGLVVHLLEHGYMISFEKGIMSMIY